MITDRFLLNALIAQLT